jgi:hypothetical protein
LVHDFRPATSIRTQGGGDDEDGSRVLIAFGQGLPSGAPRSMAALDANSRVRRLTDSYGRDAGLRAARQRLSPL